MAHDSKWVHTDNWRKHCVEIHYDMPTHDGGFEVVEWIVAVYIRDLVSHKWGFHGSSADTTMHNLGVLRVTPLEKWHGQECMFQIITRNDCGWSSTASSAIPVQEQILEIPRIQDVARLDAKELKKLKTPKNTWS